MKAPAMIPAKSKHHRDKDNLELPLLPGGRNLIPKDIEMLIDLGQDAEVENKIKNRKDSERPAKLKSSRRPPA